MTEFSPRQVFNVDTDSEVTLVGKETEGNWTAPPSPNVLPVTNEDYISNVRNACKLDLPNVTQQPENDRIMVMICGGASAKHFLDDIRAKSLNDKYDVFCSNKTHDWLIENDIIPHTEFIIDPKPSKAKDIQTPHKDVRYLINISCVPEVFKNLEGYNVHRLFALSGVKYEGLSDIAIIRAFFADTEFSFLEGGSMAGLRAMTLANLLGYRTVEFYGFDSCFYDMDNEGYPVYYAYDKSRAEDIMEAQTDSGKTYMTTPVFASQARQFIKWKHRLEWMNFIVHGDSLTYEVNRIDEEKNALKGKLISDYMLSLNKSEHKRNKNFGSGTCTDVGMSTHAGTMAVLAGQLIKNYGSVTMLDYGCGKREFANRMPPVIGLELNSYDPCIDGFNDRPEPADIVVCLDVLEHVELDYLNDVLNDLESLTRKICYVSICTTHSSKYYSDGQNQHLIQEDHEWWYPKLRKRFDVIEWNITKKHVTAVLQKKGVVSGNNGG